MEISDIIITGIVICLAGMVQSAIGFGYALFATPLLLLLGIPLLNTIVIVATCSMTQSAIGTIKLRASIPWRLSLSAVAVRTTALIIGLFVLKQLVAANTDIIKTVIGAILCLLVIIQLLCRPQQKKQIHWCWAGLAFSASGILAGICGMGGPPLVLWVMAHDWSTQRTRGFLFSVFAISVPLQIILLYTVFGRPVLINAGIGIAFFPLVHLGAYIGLPLGNRMSKKKLKYIAYAILLIIGITAITPSLLAYLK